MENESKSAVDEFLGDLKGDPNQDPLATNQDDPFASTQTVEEVKAEEVAAEEVKPLPFHKDPKVQRYIEREISKRIPEPKPEVEQSKDNSYDDVINAFTKIVGNDTPEKIDALSALKNSLENVDAKAAQRAYERLDNEYKAEQAIEAEYDNRIADGFEGIEESTGVNLYAPQNKKLRGQFIDFIEQIAPKEDGEISELPDIEQAFNAFQMTRRSQAPTQQAKQLASRTMERSEGETSTEQKPKRMDWNWAKEQMSKLH